MAKIFKTPPNIRLFRVSFRSCFKNRSMKAMTGMHWEAAHDFPPDKGGSRGVGGTNHAKGSNFTAEPLAKLIVTVG
jgi:hypothetical protein